MQPIVFSPSADVFVVLPLRKNFLNGRATKTSAEGEKKAVYQVGNKEK